MKGIPYDASSQLHFLCITIALLPVRADLLVSFLPVIPITTTLGAALHGGSSRVGRRNPLGTRSHHGLQPVDAANEPSAGMRIY